MLAVSEEREEAPVTSYQWAERKVVESGQHLEKGQIMQVLLGFRILFQSVRMPLERTSLAYGNE